MIRQAHTYLAGAVSGTALVAAAVVAFVLLVSFQALRDWPLADISLGGDDNAASAPNSAAGSQAGPAASGAAGGAAAATAAGPTNRNPSNRVATQGSNTVVGAVPSAPSGSPAAESPTSSPVGGGPAGSSPSGSSSASSSPSGGNGGGASTPAPGANGSGSQSTSGAVTGAVNNTVSGVDEATGGVVGSTGVTKVTEEVVNEVAGPESPVGKTVDETVKTVGGLLGK